MLRIVLDVDKCDGCRTCEAICSLVNEGEFNPVKSRIKIVRTISSEILHSMPVFCLQCVKHCYTKAPRLLPAERVGIVKARAKAGKFLEMERRAA